MNSRRSRTSEPPDSGPARNFSYMVSIIRTHTIESTNKSVALPQKAAGVWPPTALLDHKSMSESESDADSSDVECPVCGKDDFATLRGMSIHHTRVHGELSPSQRNHANGAAMSTNTNEAQKMKPGSVLKNATIRGSQRHIVALSRTTAMWNVLHAASQSSSLNEGCGSITIWCIVKA